MSVITEILKSMLEFVYAYTGNYGLAIIGFTVITKVILLPLTFKQMDSQRKMQVLQPEIKKIQDKYKNDKEKLNKKTMELYQKNKVNPLSGCLPLVVQIPIIFALFTVIRQIDFGGQGFLWIRNLGLADAYVSRDIYGEAIEPYFNGYYILPILSAVSQFYSMKMMSGANQGAEAGKGMMGGKGMTYFFPLFSGYLCATFPAGLALYWVVGNMLQIIQQLFIKPATEKTVKEGAK